MFGDDEDIAIEVGDQKKYFNHEEANDANAVRIRFELDHEPACVYLGKKKNLDHWRLREHTHMVKKHQDVYL